MPTSDQIATVLMRFESILPRALEIEARKMYSIDMGQSAVYNDCGSPMCHGGWYAAASNIQRNTDFTHYDYGAKLMAHDLGFTDKEKLKEWADQNPKIWGNPYGIEMFCHRLAFVPMGAEITSLKQIYDHWKGVYDRVKAMEDFPKVI